MTGIKGIECIFFIKHQNEWCPIACEMSNSMSESVSMIGTTTRDNKGWKTSLPTEQEYSFSIEGQTQLESSSDILSYFSLREKKRNRERIEWKREYLNGAIIDNGFGYITQIGDANAVEGMATFSLSIVGFGKPETGIDEEILTPLLSQQNNELLFNNENEGLATKDI